MGGKKGGLVRQATDLGRTTLESATDKLGLGKGLGRSLYTFGSPQGMMLEGGAMVEDTARAPGVAKQAAKDAQNQAKIEQDKLMGAATQRLADEKAISEATADTAGKLRANMSKRKTGRSSTLLTGVDAGLNQTLGSAPGSTILGS